MKLFLSFVMLVCFLLSSLTFAAGNVNTLAYASTNVTTSAYVVLWASIPASASKLQICDNSGHILKIAKGATGSEVDICTVQLSGCVIVPIYLPIGTQLSIKAVDAIATTGFNTVSVL